MLAFMARNNAAFHSARYHYCFLSARTHYYQGPSQVIKTVPGRDYHAQSWIKILNDKPGTLGQTMELEVDFLFPGGQF